MMNDEFVGRLLAFKGEGKYIPETNVLLEVTDVTDDTVEVAFTSQLPGKPRFYLRFSLAELILQAMTDKK